MDPYYHLKNKINDNFQSPLIQQEQQKNMEAKQFNIQFQQLEKENNDQNQESPQNIHQNEVKKNSQNTIFSISQQNSVKSSNNNLHNENVNFHQENTTQDLNIKINSEANYFNSNNQSFQNTYRLKQNQNLFKNNQNHNPVPKKEKNSKQQAPPIIAINLFPQIEFQDLKIQKSNLFNSNVSQQNDDVYQSEDGKNYNMHINQNQQQNIDQLIKQDPLNKNIINKNNNININPNINIGKNINNDQNIILNSENSKNEKQNNSDNYYQKYQRGSYRNNSYKIQNQSNYTQLSEQNKNTNNLQNTNINNDFQKDIHQNQNSSNKFNNKQNIDQTNKNQQEFILNSNQNHLQHANNIQQQMYIQQNTPNSNIYIQSEKSQTYYSISPKEMDKILSDIEDDKTNIFQSFQQTPNQDTEKQNSNNKMNCENNLSSNQNTINQQQYSFYKNQNQSKYKSQKQKFVFATECENDQDNQPIPLNQVQLKYIEKFQQNSNNHLQNHQNQLDDFDDFENSISKMSINSEITDKYLRQSQKVHQIMQQTNKKSQKSEIYQKSLNSYQSEKTLHNIQSQNNSSSNNQNNKNQPNNNSVNNLTSNSSHFKNRSIIIMSPNINQKFAQYELADSLKNNIDKNENQKQNSQDNKKDVILSGGKNKFIFNFKDELWLKIAKFLYPKDIFNLKNLTQNLHQNQFFRKQSKILIQEQIIKQSHISPDYFNNFLSIFIDFDYLQQKYPNLYKENLEKENEFQTEIYKDNDRTSLNENKNFLEKNGPEILAKILKASTFQLQPIGYIQGWHQLGAIFVESIQDEIKAFWTYQYFLKQLDILHLFANCFEGQKILQFSLKAYLKEYLREIYDYYNENEINIDSYIFMQFLMLFSYDLPLVSTQKLWMLLFLKGKKMIIQFTLKLLQDSFEQVKLINDMDQLNDFFKSFIAENFENNIFKDENLMAPQNQYKVTNQQLKQLQNVYLKCQEEKEENDSILEEKQLLSQVYLIDINQLDSNLNQSCQTNIMKQIDLKSKLKNQSIYSKKVWVRSDINLDNIVQVQQDQDLDFTNKLQQQQSLQQNAFQNQQKFERKSKSLLSYILGIFGKTPKNQEQQNEIDKQIQQSEIFKNNKNNINNIQNFNIQSVQNQASNNNISQSIKKIPNQEKISNNQSNKTSFIEKQQQQGDINSQNFISNSNSQEFNSLKKSYIKSEQILSSDKKQTQQFLNPKNYTYQLNIDKNISQSQPNQSIASFNFSPQPHHTFRKSSADNKDLLKSFNSLSKTNIDDKNTNKLQINHIISHNQQFNKKIQSPQLNQSSYIINNLTQYSNQNLQSQSFSNQNINQTQNLSSSNIQQQFQVKHQVTLNAKENLTNKQFQPQAQDENVNIEVNSNTNNTNSISEEMNYNYTEKEQQQLRKEMEQILEQNSGSNKINNKNNDIEQTEKLIQKNQNQNNNNINEYSYNIQIQSNSNNDNDNIIYNNKAPISDINSYDELQSNNSSICQKKSINLKFCQNQNINENKNNEIYPNLLPQSNSKQINLQNLIHLKENKGDTDENPNKCETASKNTYDYIGQLSINNQQSSLDMMSQSFTGQIQRISEFSEKKGGADKLINFQQRNSNNNNYYSNYQNTNLKNYEQTNINIKSLDNIYESMLNHSQQIEYENTNNYQKNKEDIQIRQNEIKQENKDEAKYQNKEENKGEIKYQNKDENKEYINQSINISNMSVYDYAQQSNEQEDISQDQSNKNKNLQLNLNLKNEEIDLDSQISIKNNQISVSKLESIPMITGASNLKIETETAIQNQNENISQKEVQQNIKKDQNDSKINKNKHKELQNVLLNQKQEFVKKQKNIKISKISLYDLIQPIEINQKNENKNQRILDNQQPQTLNTQKNQNAKQLQQNNQPICKMPRKNTQPHPSHNSLQNQNSNTNYHNYNQNKLIVNINLFSPSNKDNSQKALQKLDSLTEISKKKTNTSLPKNQDIKKLQINTIQDNDVIQNSKKNFQNLSIQIPTESNQTFSVNEIISNKNSNQTANQNQEIKCVNSKNSQKNQIQSAKKQFLLNRPRSTTSKKSLQSLSNSKNNNINISNHQNDIFQQQQKQYQLFETQDFEIQQFQTSRNQNQNEQYKKQHNMNLSYQPIKSSKSNQSKPKKLSFNEPLSNTEISQSKLKNPFIYNVSTINHNNMNQSRNTEQKLDLIQNENQKKNLSNSSLNQNNYNNTEFDSDLNSSLPQKKQSQTIHKQSQVQSQNSEQIKQKNQNNYLPVYPYFAKNQSVNNFQQNQQDQNQNQSQSQSQSQRNGQKLKLQLKSERKHNQAEKLQNQSQYINQKQKIKKNPKSIYNLSLFNLVEKNKKSFTQNNKQAKNIQQNQSVVNNSIINKQGKNAKVQ